MNNPPSLSIKKCIYCENHKVSFTEDPLKMICNDCWEKMRTPEFPPQGRQNEPGPDAGDAASKGLEELGGGGNDIDDDCFDTIFDQCIICGCTDLKACEGGCYWVAPGLCSKCAEKMNEAVINIGPISSKK